MKRSGPSPAALRRVAQVVSKLVRRGLSESLEAYAARLGAPPHEVRTLWRVQGLLALRPDLKLAGPAIAEAVQQQNTVCAIAPGVSVPTGFVVLDEDPELGDVYAPGVRLIDRTGRSYSPHA